MNNTRKIKVGPLTLGGNSPILIQSMTNSKTSDYEGTKKQILALSECGCDIIRMTVPDMESVRNIPKYKALVEKMNVALVADIHFDYRLAVESAEAGIDKIRINPGNIGDIDRVKAVADICRMKNIPIRVGVNGGSLDKNILSKYGRICADALVDSAMEEITVLDRCDFHDYVISVKSSDVREMIDAYTKLSKKTDAPLHLGVTEAGTLKSSLIKSSIGIGSLLLNGIGDTIRVSITDDVTEEVYAAKKILTSLGLYNKGSFSVTSCPTCGRTNIDIVGITKKVEEELLHIEPINGKNIKVAVMGCIVNGPGEASDADIGIAGGKGEALLFKNGVTVCKIPEGKIIETLLYEIEKMRN